MRYISRTLLVLLALRLVLGIAYSALIPLGEAPDEADHYAYAAYIGREGRLPAGTEMTQAKHPPVYHALAAAAASWTGMDFGFLRSNPDGGVAPGQAPNFFVHTSLENWPWRDGALAMHLGRLVSVLAGVVLVLATYALGRAIWPDWPAAALAGAALAAFIPEALFIGGAMSNDMLAAAFGGLSLWVGTRKHGTRLVNALLAGAFIGLAFLTKVSAVAVAPVALAGLWLSARQDGKRVSPGLHGEHRNPVLPHPGRSGNSPTPGFVRLLAPVAVAAATAAVIAAPWVWRNWQLYGDPLGWPVVLGTIDRRTSPLGLADLWWMARGWFFSFWGKFGGAGQLPLPTAFYVLWSGLLLLAAAGWLRRLLESRRSRVESDHKTPPAGSQPEAEPREPESLNTRMLRWLVLLGAPTLVALSIVSYGRVALGTDQGRLLFPALAPIALLIGGGAAAWWPRRRAALISATWVAGLAAAAVVALVVGILQPYAPPPAQNAQAAGATTANTSFSSQITLVSWTWDAQAGRLTLDWQAQGPARDDLRSAVRLVDAQDELLWEWKRSPGEGRYSTDRWQPGQVIADAYSLPKDKLLPAAQLEVGVYAFSTGAWLQPDGADTNGPFLVLASGSALR